VSTTTGNSLAAAVREGAIARGIHISDNFKLIP
jgi:hypothetical protein